MKKQFLSLLMALCLMLTLAPAAFATDSQPDTITLPNGEVREIEDVSAPETPMLLSEDDSVTADITISTVQEFDNVSRTDWYSGKTIKITNDLNLSQSTKTPAEWGGFIQYFYGHLIGEKADGSAPVISGIPNNCSLIYGIIGGTIENLEFAHSPSNENGAASFITFMPTTMGGVAYPLTMRDVTVTGNISLTGSDQSNYSPFVYSASAGGITMENCVNKANISGTIYGSVFYGYYPLYITSYKFDGCENYGDITMQYAGLFFGNSSTLETKLSNSDFNLTITGCANYGAIRGTAGASYLVAPVASGSIGTIATTVESILDPEETAGDLSSYSRLSVSEIATKRSSGSDGSLCEGNVLAGFSAVLNSDQSITVTRATNESDVAYYVIAVSAYVNLWDNALGAFNGTDRCTVMETYNKGDLSGATFVPELMAYGFADTNFGEEDLAVAGHETRYGADGKTYYRVDNSVKAGTTFRWFVSNQIVNGQPVGGGSKAAQIVTVSAYNSAGTLLDVRTLK